MVASAHIDQSAIPCYVAGNPALRKHLTLSKQSRFTKAKPTAAETTFAAPKSTMICDGPQSRLTKSTDAAIATGSLRRFTGWSLKTPLMAVSRKFSFGSWNQWAISKEIRQRILRKYFPPFKERAHEACLHLRSFTASCRLRLTWLTVHPSRPGVLPI